MELNAKDLTDNERVEVILKFQEKYKTKEEKEKALTNMTNDEIYFLIECMDNIYGKMFYSKFLKR